MVPTLSLVIFYEETMVTKPSPSCESIMPQIISFGDISINFNIDGVTLLLLMVLLVVFGTVLLKILKLVKSFFD